MLIERIAFKDFLTFRDKQSIDLSADGDRSVVVILAPNNTGKTNVLRALRFLLYGNAQEGVDRLPCEALVHHPSSTDAKELTSYVEATVINGDRRCRIRREIGFSVRNGSVVLHGKPLLQGYWVHDAYDEQIDDPETIVKRFVPEEMFDFYYFAGEDLYDKLFAKSKRGTVPQHLQKILYRGEWEALEKNLKRVASKFASDGKADSEKREKWLQLEADEDRTKNAISKIEGEMEDLEEKIQDADRLWQEADADVRRLVAAGDLDVSKKLESANAELKKAERAVDRFKTWTLFGDSKAAKAIAASQLEPACKICADLRNRRALPADVSETLLAEIVEDEVCICDRPCRPGTPEREAIDRLREKSLSVTVQTALLSVERLATPGRDGNAISVAREVAEAALKRQEQQLSAFEWLQEAEKRKRELEQVKNPEREKEYREALHDRHRHQEKRDELRGQLTRMGTDKSREENRLQNIRRQKSKPGVKPAAEVPYLVKAQETAEQFQSLAERCKSALHNRVVQILQEGTNQLYSKIVTDGSTAVIDKDSLLPRIEKNGRKLTQAGGGQKQVLTLSFLTALARCRQEVNDELRNRFTISGVNEQGFFMDSILAPMDLAYQSNTVKHLPTYMPQLVMLFANQQWNDNAETFQRDFKKHGARYFGMTLHTSNMNIDESFFEYVFKGERILLRRKLTKSEGKLAFTTVEELE